jgi:hypothetical protein
MRTTLALASIIAAVLLGCTSEPDAIDQWQAAVNACHLNGDPSITRDVEIHACDPNNTKKTTICHIPPGNPANEHTICVGNAAVPAHVRNHGDPIGPCPNEPPCGGADAGPQTVIDAAPAPGNPDAAPAPGSPDAAPLP